MEIGASGSRGERKVQSLSLRRVSVELAATMFQRAETNSLERSLVNGLAVQREFTAVGPLTTHKLRLPIRSPAGITDLRDATPEISCFVISPVVSLRITGASFAPWINRHAALIGFSSSR